MATDFDLAEHANVPVEVVRAWLKRRGYGGRRGQRIKPVVERAFIDAHQSAGASMLDHVGPARSPARSPGRSPAQSPARAPEPSRSKPLPKAPPQPSIIARDQARRIADLQRELADARAALQAAQSIIARTPAPAARPALAPKPSAPAPASVRTVLARQGLEGRHAIEALSVALAQQPERILSALTTLDAAVFERVQPVCPTVACRTVATFDGWHVVAVGAQGCAVCKGSDNRRWFRLMAARLKRARCERLLVVGGGPSSHTELRRLLRDASHLDVQIVDASKSFDARQAKALVLGVDVAVFWTSTILPHAVSDPIKEAARSAPRLIRAATPVGGKGIAALCKTVITALDEQHATRR